MLERLDFLERHCAHADAEVGAARAEALSLAAKAAALQLDLREVNTDKQATLRYF